VEAVQLFGRRTPADQAVEQEQEDLEVATGKGRATPKRRDAEAARKKRMTPPRTRKEANALHRERSKDQRAKQRMAMAGTGDDRYLPARDQGPVKRYIRDWIDSRRTIGEFLIPVFFLMFILMIVLTPITQYVGSFAWVIILVLLGFDSIRIIRGVKRDVAAKFGESETHGITMYALMRSWQMRRLRLPKPAVKPGGDPV
jgi:hypothetical protein